MTLIEAIKSGRPFARKKYKGAVGVADEYGPWENGVKWLYSFQLEDHENHALVIDDILADDWEIQEPTVTITRSQFWEVINVCLGAVVGSNEHRIMSEIAKKLGLEG